MLLARYGFKRLWVLFLFLLAACSPAPETGNDTEGDEYHTEDLESTSEELAWMPDQDMLANGWRLGTLTIKLRIHQKGDAIETTATNKTESSWETAINAESTQKVLVGPDLRVLVPDDEDEEGRRSAFKSEPYYISEALAPAVVSGSVTNQLRWNNLSPNANDFISMTRVLDETGEVVEFAIERMSPSLYGKGYEATVRLVLGTRKQMIETAQPANNAVPVVTRSDNEEGLTLSFLLFPVPNANTLNDFPFWESDTPADIVERQRREHLETLGLLNQIQAGAVPALTELRTGMVTSATKDKLQLTYEYSGNKQPAFMIGIESFVGNPSENVLKIAIDLTAE